MGGTGRDADCGGDPYHQKLEEGRTRKAGKRGCHVVVIAFLWPFPVLLEQACIAKRGEGRKCDGSWDGHGPIVYNFEVRLAARHEVGGCIEEAALGFLLLFFSCCAWSREVVRDAKK